MARWASVSTWASWRLPPRWPCACGDPRTSVGAPKSIAWKGNVVLMICGILTFVSNAASTSEPSISIGNSSSAHLRIPLLAAFVICLIAGAVSAFASSAATNSALVPVCTPASTRRPFRSGICYWPGRLRHGRWTRLHSHQSEHLPSPTPPTPNSSRSSRAILRWGLSVILVAPASAWLISLLSPQHLSATGE